MEEYFDYFEESEELEKEEEKEETDHLGNSFSEEPPEEEKKAPDFAEGESDPIRIYLKEMGAVPLLSKEEEIEIAKRINLAGLIGHMFDPSTLCSLEKRYPISL